MSRHMYVLLVNQIGAEDVNRCRLLFCSHPFNSIES